MYTNLKTDVLKNTDIQKMIPLVNLTTHIDHFKPHLKKHRNTRDSMTGDMMCDMLSYASAGTRNNLFIEVEDFLINVCDVSRAEVDDLEFADCYEYVRERHRVENNGRSCANSFWQAAWGVYSSGMLTIAKNHTSQLDMFDKLFDK